MLCQQWLQVAHVDEVTVHHKVFAIDLWDG